MFQIDGKEVGRQQFQNKVTIMANLKFNLCEYRITRIKQKL